MIGSRVRVMIAENPIGDGVLVDVGAGAEEPYVVRFPSGCDAEDCDCPRKDVPETLGFFPEEVFPLYGPVPEG